MHNHCHVLGTVTRVDEPMVNCINVHYHDAQKKFLEKKKKKKKQLLFP